jgi:hypothetical protein
VIAIALPILGVFLALPLMRSTAVVDSGNPEHVPTPASQSQRPEAESSDVSTTLQAPQNAAKQNPQFPELALCRGIATYAFTADVDLKFLSQEAQANAPAYNATSKGTLHTSLVAFDASSYLLKHDIHYHTEESAGEAYARYTHEGLLMATFSTRGYTQEQAANHALIRNLQVVRRHEHEYQVREQIAAGRGLAEYRWVNTHQLMKRITEVSLYDVRYPRLFTVRHSRSDVTLGAIGLPAGIIGAEILELQLPNVGQVVMSTIHTVEERQLALGQDADLCRQASVEQYLVTQGLLAVDPAQQPIGPKPMPPEPLARIEELVGALEWLLAGKSDLRHEDLAAARAALSRLVAKLEHDPSAAAIVAHHALEAVGASKYFLWLVGALASAGTAETQDALLHIQKMLDPLHHTEALVTTIRAQHQVHTPSTDNMTYLRALYHDHTMPAKVRGAAALAAAENARHHGDPQFSAALAADFVDTMTQQGAREEQITALAALGNLGDEAAMDVLIETATNTDAIKAITATRALRHIKAPEVTALLVQTILKPPHGDAQRTAAVDAMASHPLTNDQVKRLAEYYLSTRAKTTSSSPMHALLAVLLNAPSSEAALTDQLVNALHAQRDLTSTESRLLASYVERSLPRSNH